MGRVSYQKETPWKLIGVLAALCVAGAVGYFGLRKTPERPQKEQPQARMTNGVHTAKKTLKHTASTLGGDRATGKVVRASSQTTNGVASAAEQVGRTEDERKAAEMRDLLDGGNEKEALRMARVLMNSPEEDVRASSVTTLGWIGVKALPELTQMLGDEDEGVAKDALTQWKMAFDEISDEAARANLLVSAIGTMKDAEDMESLVLSFSQISNELAVQSLVKIIQGNNAAATAVAREHYEFITQEPFTTPEAAAQWIQKNNLQENTVNQ